MRNVATLLGLITYLAVNACGQENSANAARDADALAAAKSYGVQITELRLNVGIDEKLSRQEILHSLEQAKKDGHVAVIETVRLSVLEQHEAMVQFSKQVPITVGTSTAGPGRTVRATQEREVGTMVRLNAQTQDGQVLLQLTYESSRFEGATSDDQPPMTHTVQFSTTLLIEPGQTTLVGSTNSDTSTLLLVAIEQ